MLLTQIGTSKVNQGKQIKKQLETAPFIKDLKICGTIKMIKRF